MLHVFKRSQYLRKNVTHYKPDNKAYQQPEEKANSNVNKQRLLPPLDGRDDRCATFGTSLRMVADLTVAFMTFDESHNSLFTSRIAKTHSVGSLKVYFCEFSKGCKGLLHFEAARDFSVVRKFVNTHLFNRDVYCRISRVAPRVRGFCFPSTFKDRQLLAIPSFGIRHLY